MAGKSPATSNGVKSISSKNSVASVIKKFEQIDKTSTPKPPSQSSTKSLILNKTSLPFSSTKTQFVIGKSPLNFTKSEQNKLSSVSKLKSTSINNNKSIQKSPEFPKKETSTRFQLPSPSLLRKTQAVIAKEQSNDFITKRTTPTANTKASFHTKSSSQKVNTVKDSSSPPFVRKIQTNEKPKSASFQKAAAFWNK